MKCDELRAYKADVTIPVYGTIADTEVYLKKDVNAVVAELKAKLEDVKATAYAESVDAGMREIRLKRALWLARAYFCGRSSGYFSGMASRCKIGQEDFYKKVSERAQRYLKASYKCRAMAEKFK